MYYIENHKALSVEEQRKLFWKLLNLRNRLDASKDVIKDNLLPINSWQKQQIKIKKELSEVKSSLAESKLLFIYSIAMHYQGCGLLLPELVSAGFIGMCKALDQYDYERDIELTAYAENFIRQAIIKEIENSTKYDELSTEKNVESIGLDLFEYLNVWEDVKKVIGTFNERQQKIIKMYYGIGCEKSTLAKIGREFGVTHEAIRLAKEKILETLRQHIYKVNWYRLLQF